MKVKELIEQLKKLDQETMVCVHGYEGGVDPLGSLGDINIDLNANDYWYYGIHEENERGETKAYLLQK